MTLLGRKQSLMAFLALMLVIAVVGVAAAAPDHPRRDFTEAPAGEDVSREYIIVQLNDPPAASYEGGIPGLARTKPQQGKFDPDSPASQAYLKHLENQHANYRSYLARNARGAEVVREYSVVLNAMVIKLNNASARKAAGGPGARAWSYSALYQPTMNVSAGLIGADALWPAAGGRENAGAGIKVGIIDSGIDDTHPFFACKDEIVHKVYASGNPPGFDVLINDHGTHVAGTVAGCVIELTEGPIIDTISGIAPAAELWDYNVFPGTGAPPGDGSAFSHDIAAALEDAVLDGMDVVNLSLGGSVQGPHDFLAEAVNATVDAGVVAAVAAGNSGPGDMTVESPGSAANALTAGATTNPHFIGIPVIVSNVGTFGAALGDFNNFDPPIVDAPFSLTTPANGCTAISEDLTGQLAIIDRGACTFSTKIRNAEAKGAIGALIVNNVAGDPVAMGHDGGVFPTIPAAMLSQNDGAQVKAAAGTETMTVDGTTVTEFITTNADILAGFSSRGPAPFTYLIKPDVTAPGVNVYSSVFNGEFAMFQGTSMATPHLAGSAALLLDLHPDWSAKDVKSAIVNTAADVVTDSNTGTFDPGVLARGNGRVDLVAADATPLSIDPVSASFGYWSGNKPVQGSLDLTLKNLSGGSLSCDVAVSGDPYVTASTDSVSLDADESTVVSLTIDAGRSNTTPSGDYDGDVTITCGGSALQVPWWVRIDR